MTIETPNTTIEADHFHVPKSTQRLRSIVHSRSSIIHASY